MIRIRFPVTTMSGGLFRYFYLNHRKEGTATAKLSLKIPSPRSLSLQGFLRKSTITPFLLTSQRFFFER